MERTWPAIVLLLWPALALADDVELELRGRVIAGQLPAVVLDVQRDVSSLHLELVRGDKKRVVFDAGPTPRGRKLEAKLLGDVGAAHYEGKLSVRFAGGQSGDMPLAFDVEVLAPLEVRLVEGSLNLDQGKAAVTLSRPAARCEVLATLDGKPERRGSARFAGEAAGTVLPLSFPVASDDVVLKLRFECWDTGDTFNHAEYPVWRLEVPHEEVIFSSGDSRVAETEAVKVERAAADIDTAVRRYGKIIAITLYVIGHTDTVGDPAANQRLSEARARSIAQALKQRGVTVPVRYAGFGETALAVPTADETAEARNRRAQYVLAATPPVAAAWHDL